MSFDLGTFGVRKDAFIPGMSGCDRCGLYKKCNSPKLEITGNGGQRILFVGGCNTKDEDRTGTHCTGKIGQLLRDVVTELGFSTNIDCWTTNAVQCGTRFGKPEPKEINACRVRVWKEIEEKKPSIIIPLGPVANTSVLFPYWKKNLGKILIWRGLQIPTEDGFWICPTVSPGYVFAHEKGRGEFYNPAVRTIFKQDIQKAFSKLGKAPVVPRIKDKVSILWDEDDIIEATHNILLENKPTAMDYEASGLKLEKKGHFLYSCSLCNNSSIAYSFLLNTPGILAALKELLQSNVPMIAHNMQYEERSTRAILHCTVRNWIHDTMQVAHLEDNRQGYIGLKTQSFVHFGIKDYSKVVDKFLKSGEKDGNAMNSVEKVPKEELLLYGGMDALLTFMLYQKQIEVMS